MIFSFALVILGAISVTSVDIWQGIRECRESEDHEHAVKPCYTSFLEKQTLEPTTSFYDRGGFASDLHINTYCNESMEEYMDFLKCLNDEVMKCYENVNFPDLTLTNTNIESSVRYFCSRSEYQRDLSCGARNTELSMCYVIGYNARPPPDSTFTHKQLKDYECGSLWIYINCLKDNEFLVTANCTEAQTTFIHLLEKSLPSACSNETRHDLDDTDQNRGADQNGGADQNDEADKNGEADQDGGADQNGEADQDGGADQNVEADKNGEADQDGGVDQNSGADQDGGENGETADAGGEGQNGRNETSQSDTKGDVRDHLRETDNDNGNGSKFVNSTSENDVNDSESIRNDNNDSGRHYCGLLYLGVVTVALVY